MKKTDYFLASLLIVLIFFFGVSAFLLADHNSAKYIPAQTTPLIEIEKINRGEIAFSVMGNEVEFGYTAVLEKEREYKRFLVVFSRPARLFKNTAKIMYDVIKQTLNSVTVGDETASVPEYD